MLLATLLGVLAWAPLAAMAQRQVFAHYMAGLTNAQTLDQWKTDISDAQSAGIDAFALNFDPSWWNSQWGPEQLSNAYQAAETLGFKLFLSLDMAQQSGSGGPQYVWTVQDAISAINFRIGSSAQLRVNGAPFVSTFEGLEFANSWPQVQASTGDLFLIPEWVNAGPGGISQYFNFIDGIFPWQAWPDGQSKTKTTAHDVEWMNALGGKAYMMPVAPWFFANVPNYGKNFLFGSDTLWYDRWEQVLQLSPAFVEIISWNDFSEAHYIGAIRTASQQDQYIINDPHVQADIPGFPHEAWRFILPYYIASYKAGARLPSVPTEGAVFWYRGTPKGVCSDGGTNCQPFSGISATQCTDDNVYVITASNSATTVTVNIGGNGQMFNVGAGMQFVQLPFNGRTGAVTVSIHGQTGTGPVQISNSCPSTGFVNFNAAVGSVAGSSSGGTCATGAPVAVTLNELVTTLFGEEIYIVGSISQLGNWDPNSAVHLNADQYTASNPLWSVTISLPVGTSFEYKYIKRGVDKTTITWESDPNRSYNVQCSVDGPVATESDSWR